MRNRLTHRFVGLPMRRHLQVVLIAVLILAGCSDSDSTELSTTTSLPGTGADTDTTVQGGDPEGEGEEPSQTTTTLRGQAVSEFQQVHREETVSGPVLHLLIPRGGYTDIDIENFIRDLRESQPGLWGVELFDNPDAQVAFAVPAAQRTDEQRQVLGRHHLVSLSEGDVLIWRGPFSSLGQSTLGS